MHLTNTQDSSANISEGLELASWDRPRSTDELQSFLSARESIVFGN